MRFVFVMDPLDRVTHDKDTTFAFIQAAQARGHECYHCLVRDLFVLERRGLRERPSRRDPRRAAVHRAAARSGRDAAPPRRRRGRLHPQGSALRSRLLSTRRCSSSAPAAGRSSSTIRAASATRTRSSTRSTSPSGRRARWSRPTATRSSSS